MKKKQLLQKQKMRITKDQKKKSKIVKKIKEKNDKKRNLW